MANKYRKLLVRFEIKNKQKGVEMRDDNPFLIAYDLACKTYDITPTLENCDKVQDAYDMLWIELNKINENETEA